MVRNLEWFLFGKLSTCIFLSHYRTILDVLNREWHHWIIPCKNNDSMEQNSWEADVRSSSTGQCTKSKTPVVPSVIHHRQNSVESNLFPASIKSENSLPCAQEPTTEPYLSQLNSVHALTPYFYEVHLILSSHQCLGPPVGPFPLNYQKLLCTSHVRMQITTWSTSCIRLDSLTVIIFWEEP